MQNFWKNSQKANCKNSWPALSLPVSEAMNELSFCAISFGITI